MLVTISLLTSQGVGRIQFEIQGLRLVFDFLILVCLGIGLVGELKEIRRLSYWFGGALFICLITLDSVVWFRYFIPENRLLTLHLSCWSLTIPIYLFHSIKTYHKVGLGFIVIGIVLCILGLVFYDQLNVLTSAIEKENITFRQFVNWKMFINYSVYLSLILLITGIAQMVNRKRSIIN